MGWVILAEAAALVAFGVLIVYELVGSSGSGVASDGPDGSPAPSPSPLQDKPLGPLTAPHVLIEKSAHRLTVYDGEVAAKTYRCAVGGGQGDKAREGDRCTPEGVFYICLKNPQSQYVLSLGLSYPNIEDAQRGLGEGLISRDQYRRIVYAIRNGRPPPWDTALGGEIMIHGNGAGRDWTLGCVALDDNDIRELYPALPVGTVVKIRP